MMPLTTEEMNCVANKEFVIYAKKSLVTMEIELY